MRCWGEGVRVAIRADSSKSVGLGHVVRCLAIAQDLRRVGSEVLFVTRDEPGSALDLLGRSGLHTEVLPAGTAGDWALDLAQTQRAVRSFGPQAVVVDSYGLPVEWESGIRTTGVRLLAVDDGPTRRHDCDILLDQNPGDDVEQRYRSLVPQQCRLLLGPDFALLREDFRQLRESGVVREPRAARRVLLFLGGGDVSREMQRVLTEIGPVAADRGLQVDAVFGAAEPVVDTSAPWLTVTGAVDDMARRMVAADVALGAAGSASWERCCVGLPAIVAAVAENQERIGRELESAGAAVYLGRAANVPVGGWATALSALLDAPDRRAALSHAAMRLVDGRGASRVVDALLAEVRA